MTVRNKVLTSTVIVTKILYFTKSEIKRKKKYRNIFCHDVEKDYNVNAAIIQSLLLKTQNPTSTTKGVRHKGNLIVIVVIQYTTTAHKVFSS